MRKNKVKNCETHKTRIYSISGWVNSVLSCPRIGSESK